MIDRDISRRFWDERAREADDPRAVTLEKESAASVAREVALYQQWLFRRLPEFGGRTDSIADIGCGNGDWTVPLARGAQRIFASDFSSGFAEHTRKRLEHEVPACRSTVACADAAELDFPFPLDLVVCGAVTQYMDDGEVARLFRKVAANLTGTGLFYFRSTVSQGRERRANLSATFQGIYRNAEWYRQELRSCGFRILAQAVATDFVADEWAHRHLAGFWRPLRTPIAFLARLVRRAYRRFKETDVLACLAAASPPPTPGASETAATRTPG